MGGAPAVQLYVYDDTHIAQVAKFAYDFKNGTNASDGKEDRIMSRFTRIIRDTFPLLLCAGLSIYALARRNNSSPATARPPTETAQREAVDTAWRTHEALRDWTGKMEAKASFALAAESAAIAGTVVLSEEGRVLATTGGLPDFLLATGRILLSTGVVAAALVVMPPLRHRVTSQVAQSNYLWFGHLRKWVKESPNKWKKPEPDTEALVRKWREGDVLPVLARQVIVSSRITWRKHRFLQASLIASGLGVGSIIAAALY